MLLTDCGIDQLESWRNRIAARFSEIVLGSDDQPGESYQLIRQIDDGAQHIAVAPETESQSGLLRFRSLLTPHHLSSELNGREQKARVIALQGLSEARNGEFVRARSAFSSAARLDPLLDLSLLPTFWNLPRRAHEAAVDALHDAGRPRDAASLAAALRLRFRPRALRAINRSDEGVND